jgi:hypothetical protein
LRAGSTITPERSLAEIFSHRPSLVMWYETNGVESCRHNGKFENGYLYEIEVPSDDSVYPHPTSVMKPDWEWLTREPMRARLVSRTAIREEERLSEAEEREWRERAASPPNEESGPSP